MSFWEYKKYTENLNGNIFFFYVIVLILVSFIIFVPLCSAKEISNVWKDEKVSSIGQKLLNCCSKLKNIEFLVGDQNEMGSWLSGSGDNIIVVNAKYIGIPDDELAFLIAHEMAHIQLSHNRESLEKIFFPSPFDQYYLIKFTREQEFAVDKRGLELLVSAGYNPDSALNANRCQLYFL